MRRAAGRHPDRHGGALRRRHGRELLVDAHGDRPQDSVDGAAAGVEQGHVRHAHDGALSGEVRRDEAVPAHGVWNAVAEQMALDEVSKKDAEQIYGMICAIQREYICQKWLLLS